MIDVDDLGPPLGPIRTACMAESGCGSVGVRWPSLSTIRQIYYGFGNEDDWY